MSFGRSALALFITTAFSGGALVGAVAPTRAAQATVAPVSTEASANLLPSGLEWHSGMGLTRVTAVAEGIVRVRIGRDGKLPEDASWAVLPDAKASAVPIRHIDTADYVGFETSELRVTLLRKTGGITIADKAGHVLLADQSAAYTTDGTAFQMKKVLPQDAHYFGLGDKFGPLDRRGHSYVMWNTDSYAYREGQDPLYKDIPFFIGFTKGTYYGVFLDNTWRTTFDFGHDDPESLRIGAAGGPIDYYVLGGPNPKQVMSGYTRLTGRPAMQPRWTLGFQQSRWSYPTEKSLRNIVDRLRADRVPADAVWLDIDYQQDYRPFTVDSKTFPNFRQMVADFSARGIRTIAITDLHIADAPNIGYSPFDSGMAQDRFLRGADGKPYVGPVWPGPSLFPDFTQAATRAWWGKLYREFYIDDGVAGFWNDMNEPAIFNSPTKTMPLDNRHRIEEPGFAPRVAEHREVHNIYGMQNHRATYEGLLALKPNERPFVMTRASYAGGQRYGVTWTGDNVSSWNHLALTVPMLESLGLGGFAFAGADIGGFAGKATPDLVTKWYELAMFTPIARSHADRWSGPQEPWGDGAAHEAIRRRFIESRYRLLPYNYTLSEEASRTGVPMMRPLFMEFPETLIRGAPMDLLGGVEFMWGPALLVAPGSFSAPSWTPESPGSYNVILPPGDWYDYWTGKKLIGLRPLQLMGASASLLKPEKLDASTPYQLSVTPQLDQLPVFVRAGSIVPHQALVQSTDDIPKGPLQIDVYPGPNCHGSVYTDDGHSLDYTKGVFSRTEFFCSTESNGGVEVKISAPEGTYHPWWQSYSVVIHGLNAPEKSKAALDGAPLEASLWHHRDATTVSVDLPATVAAHTIVVQ
jgi:alpha-glucosidase